MADEVVEESGHIQARFVTKQKQYAVTDNPFSVPTSCRVEELSSLVNGLLQSGSDAADEKLINFDFIIDGEFLRDSLQAYLQEKAVSFENVLEIEYLEKHSAPQPQINIAHDDWISSVATCSEFALTGCYDNKAHIWSIKGGDMGKSVAQADGHKSPVKAVQWIQHGKDQASFITGSQDQTIRLYQWAGGSDNVECLHVCKGHSQSVDCLAVNPGKDKFCSGSWDKTLKIWSTVCDGEASEDVDNREIASKKQKTTTKNKKPLTRTPLMTLDGHKDAVSSVLWMDKDELCSGSWDHCIRLWDVPGGVNKQTLTGNKGITSLSYSASSRLLASACTDKYVRLWDPRTQNGAIVKMTLAAHAGWVSSVAWSPSNQYELVSGSYDCKTILWDTRSPKAALHSLTEHKDKVLCLDWRQEQWVMSGGADCQLVIYNMPRVSNNNMEN